MQYDDDNERTISHIQYSRKKALLFALNHCPENTPSHWEVIAMVKPDAGYEDDLKIFILTYSNAPKCIKKVFTGSANQCQQYHKVILPIPQWQNQAVIYWPLLSNADRKSPLKPIIITPPISQCWDSTPTCRNRLLFPIVYTTTCTYITASYHRSVITVAKYIHYKVPHENNAVLYDVAKQTRYIQIWSETVFEIRASNELPICSTTFEALANAYTMNNLE